MANRASRSGDKSPNRDYLQCCNEWAFVRFQFRGQKGIIMAFIPIDINYCTVYEAGTKVRVKTGDEYSPYLIFECYTEKQAEEFADLLLKYRPKVEYTD